MFKRKIQKKLEEYYKDKNSSIVIIDGARQIGKSFIIRETARSTFKNYIEVDLKSDYEGEKLFEDVKTTKSFYLIIGSLFGESIGDIDDTIVFLDEIQYYPHLITLLKDLKKEAKYRFIASGSLLGVTLKHIFIPMGSINEIRMYPMDFEEFLWANNVSSDSIDYLHDCFLNRKQIDEQMHRLFLSLFKDYLACGGLPDAVTEYVVNRNVARMRNLQSQIFTYYKDDCSRYDFENKLKISKMYELVISNMENKVKRFVFKKIDGKENSSLRKYEDEIDYLNASGIVNQTCAVSNPIFPLNESKTKKMIKLYYNDVGILTNLLYRTNIKAIINVDSGVNLGSVYETACAMELTAHGHDLFYFDSKKVGEVDFLVNDYDRLSVLPIEIKSGKDQNNFRAIPKLVAPNGNYKLPCGYVLGNKNIMTLDNNLMIMPIYLIMFI